MARAVALLALLLAACTAHEEARVEPRREEAAPAAAVVWTDVKTRAELLAALRVAEHTRPVVLVFHAAWAMQCVELERRVFVDPVVAAELRRFTAIRVDVTEDGAAELQALFGAETLPHMQMFAVDSGLAQALAAGEAPPRSVQRVTTFVGPDVLASVLAAVR